MSMLKNQKETAKALGVCVNTLRRWAGCPKVEISRDKNGKAICRYDVQQVRAWLESRTAGKGVQA